MKKEKSSKKKKGKVFTIILIVVCALAGLLLAVLAYSGMFRKVEVVEQDIEAMTIVYKEHRGQYYEVGPTMDEVYDGLMEMGIETYKGVGIYYGDPDEVAPEDLHSDVGSILEEGDLDKVEQIKEKFSVTEIPAQKALVVKFPMNTMLSYMIAPMRVYPAFSEYLEARGIPEPETGIEIYDVPNKESLYVMPLGE